MARLASPVPLQKLLDFKAIKQRLLKAQITRFPEIHAAPVLQGRRLILQYFRTVSRWYLWCCHFGCEASSLHIYQPGVFQSVTSQGQPFRGKHGVSAELQARQADVTLPEHLVHCRALQRTRKWKAILGKEATLA